MNVRDKLKYSIHNLVNDKIGFSFCIISIIFSILFTLYSFLQFNLMDMSAWDLGVYTQALYSGIHGHLFYTALLPGSYLSEHFSPILFLLVIPYYIYPHAYTLFIIQGFAIGLSAYVLYRLSLEILNKLNNNKNTKSPDNRIISFILALAFLLSPLTESPVFFDFHLMIFLPLFFFLALYFFIRKNILLNILFTGLIVSLHSAFVFIAIMLVIFELFIDKTLYLNISRRKITSTGYLAISIVLLGSYFILAGIIKTHIAGVSVAAVPTIHVSGSASPVALLIDVFTRPLYVAKLLTANYHLKLIILFYGLAGSAFLFLRYPKSIFLFVPYILYAMFSVYQPYYTIGYQYTMMFIPMVAVSAIIGIYIMLKKSDMHPSYRKQVTVALAVIMIISITGFSIAAPLVSGDPCSPSLYDLSNSMENKTYMHRIDFEHKVANSINKNARIVTENAIFPLFGNDPNATAFPYTSDIVVNGSYYQYLVNEPSSVWARDTANIDSLQISLNQLQSNYENSGQYGIYAQGYGIIVLEKGYTGKPVFTGPA